MEGAGDGAQARIVLKDLTKIYGGGSGSEVPAVDTVSFDVREGEFVALIGPSGCGKSTILNMVAGLIPLSGGEILIDERPVVTGTPTPKVGYVFQRDTVYPWRTVRKNIGLGLELNGVPKAEREKQVAEIVGRAGLGGFEDAFPITLSGGM
ncbi:MAG: ATP-binding cassette domain-containing protein, partial [Pseudomonadota bacterium]